MAPQVIGTVISGSQKIQELHIAEKFNKMHERIWLGMFSRIMALSLAISCCANTYNCGMQKYCLTIYKCSFAIVNDQAYSNK